MIVKEKYKQIVTELEKNIEDFTEEQLRVVFMAAKKELGKRKGDK